MLSIMLDGLFVLYTYKEAILAFFVTVLGLGVFSVKYAIKEEWESGIEWAMALGIGSVVLCFYAFLLVFVSHFFPFLLKPGGYAILFFALFVLLQALWSGGIKVTHNTFIIIGLMALLALLRLSFLKYILLPPYSDSSIHYQIVFGFLHPEVSSGSKISLDSILSNYYHLGFHSLTAWLASVADLEPANAIALVGQLFLIIGPFSILFLVYTLTRDTNGAFFAGVLAAIGWSMPAFAVNWGKYPALSALAVMPTVMAFLNSSLQGRVKKGTGLFLGAMLLLGILLMHTRIIIGVLLLMACFFAANKLPVGEKLKSFQATRYSILYIISLWPLQQFLANYYSGFIVAMLLALLLFFAFREFPKLATTVFLFTFTIWLLTSVPLAGDSYRALDRQFLEMLLYIPLSMMGGVGLSGILKLLPPVKISRPLIMAALTGLVVLNFSRVGVIYPDTCCDYFKEDDQQAFQWLQKQAREHSLVLISAFENDGQTLGTDAGIWIYPLTGLPTNKWHFETDWASLVEREKVCRLGAGKVYIYAGGRGYSFNDGPLAQQDWAQEVFKAGHTTIYQVSACTKSSFKESAIDVILW